MDRLRRLRKNVGWPSTIQVVALFLLLTLLVIAPALTPKMPWYPSLTVLACWVVPFALRRVLVKHWEFMGPFLQRAGLVIWCVSVASGVASKDIKAAVPEDILFTFIAGVIAQQRHVNQFGRPGQGTV